MRHPGFAQGAIVKRFRRWLFNGITALSLTLWLVAVVLWLRGFSSRGDTFAANSWLRSGSRAVDHCIYIDSDCSSYWITLRSTRFASHGIGVGSMGPEAAAYCAVRTWVTIGVIRLRFGPEGGGDYRGSVLVSIAG